MLYDPEELEDDVEWSDDWETQIETFITQNPGSGNVYISDSLRIPLTAVSEIMSGLAAEGRPTNRTR